VLEIILRKALKRWSEDTQSMGGRLESDWAMGCGGEAMPECGLNQICREQLPNPFQ